MITQAEAMFLIVIFGWILLWSLWFLPYFNTYLMAHPEFPTPYAFLIHQSGYWISLLFIGYILTGQLPHSLRFSLGVIALLIAFEISVAPTCISPSGEALITPENQSCRMGNDFFVSWIFNTYFSIPYGKPVMFYLTYIVGTIGFAFIAALLLKEKEMWESLIGGIFG